MGDGKRKSKITTTCVYVKLREQCTRQSQDLPQCEPISRQRDRPVLPLHHDFFFARAAPAQKHTLCFCPEKMKNMDMPPQLTSFHPQRPPRDHQVSSRHEDPLPPPNYLRPPHPTAPPLKFLDHGLRDALACGLGVLDNFESFVWNSQVQHAMNGRAC